MSPRIAFAAAALALIALLGGCTPESSLSPSASPSSSATFTSDAEAFAAAEKTYRAYVDALNAVDLSNPETFEPVFALTTGELNDEDRRSFGEWHQDGVQLVGQARITELSRGNVDLSTGEVTLEACYDVSSVDVLAIDGASLVDEGRPEILVIDVHFVDAPTMATTVLIDRILPGRVGREC